MCGRYRTDSPDSINEHFQFPVPFPGGRHLNIAPTDLAAIVTNEEPRRWSMARWGLIPPGAHDPGEAHHTFNARLEKLATMGIWRGSFRRRRCLVPADGYYQWTPIPGRTKKQPHLVGLRDWRPFAFAGLWNDWMDRQRDTVIRSFTIITCPPDDFTRSLHNRMPLILDPSSWSAWLDAEERAPEELWTVLTPITPREMQEELCADPRRLEAEQQEHA